MPPSHDDPVLPDVPRQAQVLAWSLEPSAAGLLATFLYQADDGAYFLQYRPLGRPLALRLIVPVTPARATAWFVAHPGHFVAADAFSA